MNVLLGPLAVQIEGEHPTRPLVESELYRRGVADGLVPDLTFDLTSNPDPMAGGIEISGTRLQLRHSVIRDPSGVLRFSVGLRHGVTLYTLDVSGALASPGPIRASVYLPPRLGFWASLSAPLARLVSRDSSTLLETAAKNVIYDIIDSLAAYRLPVSDASLLHASALARNGKAIALAGTGGVGKSTSLLAAMACEPSLQYMSDDYAVVDGAGQVYRHPKRLQVYAYNVDRLPREREAVMAMMGTASRWRWLARRRLLGPKQARIRVSPEKLFGAKRVADQAELGAAVWIWPAAIGKPSLVRSDPERLARRCAVALLQEIWDFVRLVNLASLLTDEAVSAASLQVRIEQVLMNAFRDVPCYELTIPYGSDPETLVESIMSVIDW